MTARKRHTNVSYKASNAPRVTDKDRIIERIKWLRLNEAIETIYEQDSLLIIDIDERDTPVLLKGAQVESRSTGTKRFIVMDIEQLDNKFVEDQCVDINDLHKEEYYDLIEGNEEALLDIGLVTNQELKHAIIDDPLAIFTFKIGDEVTINCPVQRRLVDGIIDAKQLPSYWYQMGKKPYLFKAKRRIDSVSNAWIYQSMINTSGEYEEPSHETAVVDKMLRCIQSQSDKYIGNKSSFISEKQHPYVNIKTPYFGQKQDYYSFLSIITNSENYRPKLITYKYMNKAIVQGIKFKINNNIDDYMIFTTSATPNHCRAAGVFMDRYSMDRALHHLRTDEIEMKYSMSKITWDVEVETAVNIFNISNIIQVNNDQSRILLYPEEKLSMCYDRQSSSILLQRFVVYPENTELVEIKNKYYKNNKNNKNNNKNK